MGFVKICSCACLALVLLLSIQTVSAGRTPGRTLQQLDSLRLNYTTGSDPKGNSITIPPLTVWTWCGFNSMDKLKAEVTANNEVVLYLAPRRTVKTAELDAAGSVVGLKGINTCKGTTCDRSAPGRLIKYSRCVAVGNLDLTKTVTASLKVSNKEDGTIRGIIAGIVIACIGAVACCIISWLCCLKKIVCCCC